MKQKLLLLLIALLTSTAASAYDFYIRNADGKSIFYNIIGSNSVMVTFHDTDNNYQYYSGDLVIPGSVEYEGVNYSVTAIGNSAFYDCYKLTSVTIPNSITSIQGSAFYKCYHLTSMTIPSAVTTIGAEAFRGCNGLTSINIPNSVISIGDRAFTDCGLLKRVNISDLESWCNITFTTGSSNPLSSAHHLYLKGVEITDLEIPNTISSIGQYAFYGGSGLVSMTIPNSVTSIDSDAFSGCSGLTAVTIPNSVTSIGHNAFYDCSGLTSVSIPNSVTSIGIDVFYNTALYNNYSNWENYVLYIDNHLIKAKGELTGPYKIKEGTISIAEKAFYNCSDMTSITIPNSVNTIGQQVFSGCNGLTSVTISNSVTSIGLCAFKGCTELPSITIPNSVTSIGYNAFGDCGALTSVNISNSVTSIGPRAFEGCTGLPSITIPNSVTSIGYNAFYDCSGIKAVTIGESVNSIEDKAFYNCKALDVVCNNSSLDLVKGSTSYGYVAYYASNVYSNVDPIGDFYFNTDTKTLILYIGDDRAITLPEDYNGGSYSIGVYAFSGKALYTITIPNNVTGIEKRAFYECPNLISVKIGSGVLTIGSNAFGNCPNLYKVFLLGNTKPEGIQNAFTSLSGRVCYVSNDKYDGISNLGTIKKYALLNSMFEVDGVRYLPISMSARTCDAVDCTYSPESTNFNLGSTVLYRGVVFNVTQANDHLLRNNPYVTEVTLDFKGIVPNCMLYGCNNITSIMLGSNISSFGATPFKGTSNLLTLKISDSPNSLSVEDNSLFRSGKLTELIVGRNINYIQGSSYNTYSPFSGMGTLRSLKLTGNITEIPDRLFYASSLEGVLSFNSGITNIGEYAFANNTNISRIEFPNSLVQLGSYAFANCKGITRVTFPTGLEIIPEGAFTGNSSLTNIIFSSTIKTIGQNAFSATNPESLRFPASLENIGTDAFNSCRNIGSIRFDDGSTPLSILYSFTDGGTKTVYIGRNFASGQVPFANSKTLESVELSNMVTTLNEGCFKGCTGLKVINIPSSITSIPGNSFNGCVALESIELPATVKTIGEQAFRDSGLQSITLDKTITNVDGEAFYGCNNLQYASISANTIGNSAFANSGLLQLDVSTDVHYISERSFEDCNKLQNALIGAAHIGVSAFRGCSSLVSATLDARVQEISSSAFKDCSSLTSINLPEGIEQIAEYTFAETSSLSEIELPKSLKVINQYAFCNSGLSSIIIPAAVNSISPYAFSQISKLTMLTFDDSENAIDVAGTAFSKAGLQTVTINRQLNYDTKEDSPFKENTTLQTVSMNDRATSLLAGMFEDCSALQSVRVSANVLEIGDRAFKGASSLTTVNIPEGLKEIRSNTFNGCSALTAIDLMNVEKLGQLSFADAGLKSIVINPTLTHMALGSFKGCHNLEEFVALSGSKSLEISNSEANRGMFADSPLRKVSIDRPMAYSILAGYGYSPFYRVTTLNTVELGDYVPEVPDNMFYGCTGLTDVVIGDGVKAFGNYAFSGCRSIQRFYFGGNVETIGEEAFSDCSAMVELWSQAVNPPVCGTQALADINKFNCELYVPLGTIDSYAAADQWQDFLFAGETTGKSIMATGISLSKLSLDMKIDDTANIVATVLPTSVQDNFPIAWSSSNEDVAVVANGKIKAVGEGECQIIASTQSNGVIMSACNVKVDKLDQELMWVQAFGGVYIGDQITFTGKAESGLDVTYTISGGDAVGTLKSNVLSVKDIGTIEITAVQPGNDRYHASNSVVRTLTVIPINAKNLTVENEVTVHIAQSLALNAQIEPVNVYDKSVMWKSLDENIVTVNDEGVITGVANGETYIVATASNGLMANCRVTVNSLGDDYLSIDDAEITALELWKMPVNLTNLKDIVSVEFDIELPEKISFETSASGYLEPALSSRCPNHNVIATLLDQRTAHLEVYSLGQDVFTGESGDSLLIIPVIGSPSITPVLVKLYNVKLYSAEGETILPGTDNASITVTGGGLMGDANENGTVNIADVIMIVNNIVGVSQPNFNDFLADVDGNGRITIADVVNVINYIIGTITEFPNHAPRRISSFQHSDMIVASANCDEDIYTVDMSLEGIVDYTAFQMNIEMPEGYEYIPESLQRTDATQEYYMAVNDENRSLLKVAVFSPTNKSLDKSDAPILTFKLRRIDKTGTIKELIISAIELADAKGNTYEFKDATCILNEAVNADANIVLGQESIYCIGMDIHVKLPNDQTIFIVDMNASLQAYDMPTGHNVISMSVPGIYIVITEHNTLKLLLK